MRRLLQLHNNAPSLASFADTEARLHISTEKAQRWTAKDLQILPAIVSQVTRGIFSWCGVCLPCQYSLVSLLVTVLLTFHNLYVLPSILLPIARYSVPVTKKNQLQDAVFGSEVSYRSNQNTPVVKLPCFVDMQSNICSYSEQNPDGHQAECGDHNNNTRSILPIDRKRRRMYDSCTIRMCHFFAHSWQQW